MTPVVDASSPALVTTSGIASTITTAAFSPPKCLLVAAVFSTFSNSAITFTVTDSTGLTWTQIQLENGASAGGKQGAAALYYATLPSAPTNMTVTATTNQYYVGLKVYAVTGAATSPVGASSAGASASQPFTTPAFNTQGAASLGFICAEDTTGNNMTSSDTTYVAGTTTGVHGLAGYKTLGSTASFQLASGATPAIDWVAAEILSAPTVVASTASVVSQAVMRAATR